MSFIYIEEIFDFFVVFWGFDFEVRICLQYWLLILSKVYKDLCLFYIDATNSLCS